MKNARNRRVSRRRTDAKGRARPNGQALTDRALWTVSPQVVARRLGGETVLVHLETDRVYTLSGTAAQFWNLLSAGARWKEIRARMLDEFAVDEVALVTSLRTLLDSLLDEDLVRSTKVVRRV